MIKHLKLFDFKSFEEADLEFGPLTALVGTNASGKSNLRDALKFLHGVGRGYNLAETFGGKSIYGGKVWDGLRGGASGAARQGQTRFDLSVALEIPNGQESEDREVVYCVAVEMVDDEPRLVAEHLKRGSRQLYNTHEGDDPLAFHETRVIEAHLNLGGGGSIEKQSFPAHQPILTQVGEIPELAMQPGGQRLLKVVNEVRRILGGMRFLELDPKVMRQPSVPGERTLSESGDNLSSVLQSISEDKHLGQAIASWIAELTPMDVAKLDFDRYPDGKVLAALIESGGQRVPLGSASDGTLRFLGILAAVFSPEPPSLLCFEELETGFHPTRLALVLDLLEGKTKEKALQVLATTHSPQLVRLLLPKHLESTYVTYRLKGMQQTSLKKLKDVPHFLEVIQESDAARLHESAWIEQTLFFSEGGAKPFELEPEEGTKP